MPACSKSLSHHVFLVFPLLCICSWSHRHFILSGHLRASLCTNMHAHTCAAQAGDFVLVCIYPDHEKTCDSGDYWWIFCSEITGGYSTGLSFKEHTISSSSTHLSLIDSCYYPSFKILKICREKMYWWSTYL